MRSCHPETQVPLKGVFGHHYGSPSPPRLSNLSCKVMPSTRPVNESFFFFKDRGQELGAITQGTPSRAQTWFQPRMLTVETKSLEWAAKCSAENKPWKKLEGTRTPKSRNRGGHHVFVCSLRGGLAAVYPPASTIDSWRISRSSSFCQLGHPGK